MSYFGFFGRCRGCAFCDAQLSTPARKGQEGAEAGNKPPTGADSGGGS